MIDRINESQKPTSSTQRLPSSGLPWGAVALMTLGLMASPTTAQTTSVAVNAGQTLSETDLNAGVFNAQTFTLSPNTIFEINDGGVIGPVGDEDNHPPLPFDFTNSTVNINNGGFFASDGSQSSAVQNLTLNILGGGLVGPLLTAFSGSRVNIAGGNIVGGFQANSGSVVNLTAGGVGILFSANAGSALSIHGAEFRLNGMAISALDGGLPEGGLFTGTLADGSVFIFGYDAADRIAAGTTVLVQADLPPLDTTPMFVSTGVGSKGLRAGQTLTMSGDAILRDNFGVVSATLNIEGGLVGDGLRVALSEVNISGGSVGSLFQILAGSTVNVSGGRVADSLHVLSNSSVTISGGNVGSVSASQGSTVNITGGSLDLGFSTSSGSTMNISGGSLGRDSTVFTGSTVNMTGGSVGDFFRANSGSTVNIFGGEFQLNGMAIMALDDGLPSVGSFAGTLADGSVFIFSEGAHDRFDAGTITLISTPLDPADTTPLFVSTGAGPDKGLRPGQFLTISGDATLRDNFAANSATMNVVGGSVGDGLEVALSEVNISGGIVGVRFGAFSNSEVHLTGGSVGNDFGSFSGSTVTISGGIVGSNFDANSGSTVNISGGSIGPFFGANADSTVNISGGRVGEFFAARSGSTVNISGGSVDIFGALSGSTVNLIVTDLRIHGFPINLTPGEVFLIMGRGGTLLEATLADGSFIDFTLNETFVVFEDLIEVGATLTATLAFCPGDTNGDQVVTFEDIMEVLANWLTDYTPSTGPGDANADGLVNFNDITSVLSNWQNSCP